MSINRFIEAQNTYFDIALKEIKNEKKITHWMWFILRQIKGLGSSYYATYYAIEDIKEAKEYIENDYLKNNYLKLCEVLLETKSNNAKEIFGYIDSIKLRSSLTLFYKVSNIDVINKVLDKFFNGELDNVTLTKI